MRYLPAIIILLGSPISCFSQLNINYVSANQFVQHLAGPGVTITNAIFTGTDPIQMAAYSGTTSPSFGLADGVLLATGDAMVASDTSNNYTAGTTLGGGGDGDLSGACNQQTKDLAAIEFDFTASTDSIEFTFVFASEEYNYWVNSKNDICGARLYNAGGGYARILYLPSSTDPISVNSINNGSVPNVGDPSVGPCMNCQYFIDNTYGLNFQYNGYTKPITIKFAVTPCVPFHFWLGIADAQDFIYDSAILLPDSSFRAIGAPGISIVGYPAGTDTAIICAGNNVTLISGNASSYNWSTGETSQSIIISTPGTYFLNTCGATSNQIVVEVLNTTPTVIDIAFCNNSQVTLNALSSSGNYLWQDSSIQSTLLVSTSGTYWVEVQSGNCSAVDTFHVTAKPAPSINLGNDTTVCGANGFSLNSFNSAASHLWSTGEQTENITATQSGLYWVELNQNGCMCSDSINIIIAPSPVIDLGNDTSMCDGNSIQLHAPTGFTNYNWNNNSYDSTITVNSEGLYWVSISENGCVNADSIYVALLSVPTLNLGPDISICAGSGIILNSNKGGWSNTWSNGNTSASITVNDSGMYWVNLTNQCGNVTDSINVYLSECGNCFYIANAFTPNNDLINDSYKPVHGECGFTNYDFKIYNRWGELIFESDDIDKGWDGKYNSSQSPMDVYVWRIVYIPAFSSEAITLYGRVSLIL